MTTEPIAIEDDDELFDADDYDEDEGNEFDLKHESIIRAKWTMDGATTLAEAAEMFQGHAQYLLDLAAEGWALSCPVEDDYGFIVKE